MVTHGDLDLRWANQGPPALTGSPSGAAQPGQGRVLHQPMPESRDGEPDRAEQGSGVLRYPILADWLYFVFETAFTSSMSVVATGASPCGDRRACGCVYRLNGCAAVQMATLELTKES